MRPLTPKIIKSIRSLAIGSLLALALFTNDPLHGGGWYVGNTAGGEWIQYDKVYFSSGSYRFTGRVACTTSNSVIRVEVDGTAVQLNVPVPNTGRADSFTNLHLGQTNISQGTHTLRIVFGSSGESLDWFMAVKDTDTTSSVKDSDITAVPPPSTGMVVLPTIAFDQSISNGHSSSLMNLGYPVPDANGHPFSDTQIQSYFAVPMNRDYDRRLDRYWDVLVDTLTALRVQAPIPWAGEVTDFVDNLQDRELDTFGWQPRWMQKLAEAVARNPQAATSVKTAILWNNGGLGSDFANIYGYNPTFSDPALVDFSLKYYIGPFLDNLPPSMIFQPTAGQFIIRVGNVFPNGVINDGNQGAFLTALSSRIQLKYGLTPKYIFQTGSTMDSGILAHTWGIVPGMLWAGPLLESNQYNGTYFCGTSPGSRHGLDQVWLNDWNPATDTGTPGGNSAGVEAHQSRLDGSNNSNFLTTFANALALGTVSYMESEGLNDIGEGDSYLRSCHQEFAFPNQHIAAMRQYSDPTSQTLVFEAEACDEYQKAVTGNGNMGGTYRRQWNSPTDLDVYRPEHNLQAWTQANAGPGNLVSIAAGFSDVWALDSAGAIWGHRIVGNPDVWTKVTSSAPSAFKVVSVGKMYAWGLTTAGAVYSTHLGQPAPCYTNQGWTSRSGTMAWIDVGDNEVWATDSSGNVYRQSVDGTDGGWTSVSGQQLDKVWVGDAHVWGIRGTTLYHAYIPTAPSTHAITFTSVSNPNNITQLDVGSDEVWGVNASGNVYRMSASAAVGTWDAVTGRSLTSISVGENYAWGLSGSLPYYCKLEGFRLSEAPIPPLGVRTNVGNGQVTLSWLPTSGATSYVVRRSTTNGSGYTDIGTTTGTSFTNTGLNNGTNYYYVVAAVGVLGNGFPSAQATVNPQAAPATATNIAASASGMGQINLTWTNNANNAIGYIVERALANIGAFTPLARITSGTATSYNDTTCFSGTSYTYRVRPYNANLVEGSNSNTATATTSGGSTIFVNFQPLVPSGNVPGYLVDYGQAYNTNMVENNGYSYGWSTGSTGQTRQRGLNSNELQDCVLLWKSGATWSIAVPNGSYNVLVGIGDGQDNTTSTVNVNGVNYWNNQSMTPGSFLTATHTVTVSNGKITMDQGSGGDNATRLDYVQIAPTATPASAPANFTLVPGNGQVLMSWSPVSGATSTGYHIKRATALSGSYTDVSTSAASPFTDPGVSNGTTYFYTISAYVGSSETAQSTPVATMPGTYQSPWQAQSIGGSLGDGGNESNNINFTLLAKGSDIWNSSDQFRYVYQSATGDCMIQACVAGIQNVDPWTKVGVMIRESLQADSTYAAALVTPGNGVGMQWRPTTSQSTSSSMSGGLSAPYWVKVTRVGNVFTAYSSPDGSTWTQSGSPQTFGMSSSCYVGLVATSHNPNVWASATMTGVTAIPSGFYTKKLVPGMVVAFLANADGKYVTADNAGANPLIANRTTVGTQEKFTVVDAGSGKVGFLAQINGLYVTADNAGVNPLIANRTSVGAWESFTEVNAGGGMIALLANANGKYVCADNAGASPLINNRTSFGAWESYTVVPQ